MRFGPVPIAEAAGAVLAHSVNLPGGKLKKGVTLGPGELARLAEAGLSEVIVARLEPGDLAEDAAAAAVTAALAPAAEAAGLSISAPFTGRVNLYAARAGLFDVDPLLVHAVNAVHEAVTLATIAPKTWVAARRMLGTVKIIPYAAPRAAVADVAARLDALRADAVDGPQVRPLAVRSARLILTRTPGMAERLLDSGSAAVTARLTALGVAVEGGAAEVVAHETGALAAALATRRADLTLVLAASATSDRSDVTPGAMTRAGGSVRRLGMPVDPGNLLALGEVGGKPVVGLPGCARSPALNGADWVLERLAAGLEVSSDEIAGMGVGGLLKEIASRPAPRAARRAAARPKIAAVLLAAGRSSRFRAGGAGGSLGDHKLLADAGGAPLIRRSAAALVAAAGPVGPLSEVIVVLGHRAEEMRAALSGLSARIVEAASWADGMAASLRAGLAATPEDADGVLVALADMPDVDAALVGRLAAAFDAEEGREIVRPMRRGRPGHPVLFGRRFFEPLAALDGDEGARKVVAAHAERLVEIEVDSDAPLTDLDTVEALQAWRAGRDALIQAG